MRFILPVFFLIISFLGTATMNVASHIHQKKGNLVNGTIEPRSKRTISLICNGENDHTPLLKRKYKAKGLKESLSIDAPDFEQFFRFIRTIRTESLEKFRLTTLLYNFERGPPVS